MNSGAPDRTFLERVLRERAAADAPAAAIFVAQWEFDSRLVGRALQSIAIAFPHYSLHDASHSRRIISYVGELLGERRVRELSSATIWLIMSAAYYHDAGMIIPDHQGRTWWTEPDFQDFLARAAGDNKHPLHDEAKLLASLDVTRDEWPFGIRRAITLVVAEYGRQRHPARAVDVVRKPGQFGIDSPRSDLIIPSRIWRVLGRVCEAHGQSFDHTMKLEKEANGVLANDKIHPRFAAAMLRLGDLLDLDNGRFCPTMSLTLGRIPNLSRIHQHKHASIDHFLVRPDVIEVRASCKEDEREVYDETQRWLSMLEQEIADQSRRWNEIAPVPNFGALPSAGPPLTVNLPKSLHSVDSNYTGAALTMASVEALKLFRDAGIYVDPGRDFVRELLQNAFDATLMRLQEEGFDPAEIEGDPTRRLYAVRGQLERYPVRVIIERVARQGAGDGGTSTWKLVVQDHGIGIGEAEIEHVRTVGQSNEHKRASGLPDWLATSGDFGVGLQSAFYMANKITLQSHDLRSRFTSEIQMYEDGRFYVFKWSSPKYTYGTTVAIEFERKNVPSSISGERGARAHDLLDNFDCVSDCVMPYEVAQILDAIEVYARGNVVPVEVIFDGEHLAISQDEPPLLYSSGIGIRRLSLATAGGLRWKHWYRGLYLSKADSPMSNGWTAWVGGEFDLYCGRSADLLNLGRNNFRDDRSGAIDRLWRCAVAVVERAFARLDDVGVQFRSVFCLVSKLIQAQAKADADVVSDESRCWVERAVEISDEIIHRVADGSDKWMTSIPIAHNPDGSIGTTLFDVREGAYIWEAEGHEANWCISPTKPTDCSSAAPVLLKGVGAIAGLFTSLSCEAQPNNDARELFSLSHDPISNHGIKDDVVHLIFARALTRSGYQLDVGFRLWAPLPPKYVALALAPGVKVWAGRCFQYLKLTGPMGILPVRIDVEVVTNTDSLERRMKISTPNLGDYVRWVHARRLDCNHSITDIAEATARLLEDFHAFVETRDNVDRSFDLDKARSELGLLR